MLRSIRIAIEYLNILIKNMAPLIFKGHPFHKKRLPSYQAFIEDERVNVAIIYDVTEIFASDVLTLPTLREIWDSKNKLRKSVKDKIFNANYNLSTSDGLTINNIITPDGFKSPIRNVYFYANKLIISLEKMNSIAAISTEEINLSLNIIVSLFESDSDSENYMTNIMLSKEIESFDFNKQFEIEVHLNNQEKTLFEKQDEGIIYISVATKTSNNRVVQYSRTYSMRFEVIKEVKIHNQKTIIPHSKVPLNISHMNMPLEEEMTRILDSILVPIEENESDVD
jgi:flagellar biosynthesis regulator FlbT